MSFSFLVLKELYEPPPQLSYIWPKVKIFLYLSPPRPFDKQCRFAVLGTFPIQHLIVQLPLENAKFSIHTSKCLFISDAKIRIYVIISRCFFEKHVEISFFYFSNKTSLSEGNLLWKKGIIWANFWVTYCFKIDQKVSILAIKKTLSLHKGLI